MLKKILKLSLVILCLGLITGCNKDKPVEKVKGYGEGEIVISVFWPPMKGFATDEQYEYLVEAGIDLLEWGSDPIFTDPDTVVETLRLCEKYGIKITITDKDFGDLTKKSDDEIKELVRRYKDHEAVVGYYLKDEPTNANPYGRVAKVIESLHPRAIAQMNMLPMGALADPTGHAEDWINSVGAGKLRYLSFDQYPFGFTPGSVPQMFPNMNLVRKIGLKYDVDTALYLQSIGVIGGFRRPTVAETRYHASAALAYGFKNLKYFTWITPVERSEDFTLAVIAPDGTKTDTYEGIKEINLAIKKVSSILGNLDALEIKHNGRVDVDTEMLEEGWHVEAIDKKDYLVSLMVDRDTGQNYLMVVNKNFKKEDTIKLKLNGIKKLTDVTDGKEKNVSIRNKEISLTIEAGAFKLLALDKNIRLQKPYPNADENNLAMEKPVYTTSSLGQNGYYGKNLVDGQTYATSSRKGWKYEGDGKGEVSVIVDLKNLQEINRIDLYPVMGLIGLEGALFPKEFTLSYSKDGKKYTKITSDSFEKGKDLSYTFKKVEARYVKLTLDKLVTIGGTKVGELNEIEIYYDKGHVPAYQIPQEKDPTLTREYNVALNKKATVSSSTENESWKAVHLTDGLIKTGWTSQVKANMDKPHGNEWAKVSLGEEIEIDTIVLYPRQDSGGYFPRVLRVDVSSDDQNWQVIYEHAESGKISAEERIFSFSPIKASYVRVVSTEMTQNPASSDGYLFQLGEIEIYKTGRKEQKEQINYARNALVFVSASGEYPQWGWSKDFINDGITKRTDNHSGFTTPTGVNLDDPKKEEWISFFFGDTKEIEKVIVYSASTGSYFPVSFKVEVSTDGENFTKVYEAINLSAKVGEMVSCQFAKTQALYVRITSIQLRNAGGGADGYLMQVGEIEIY